MDEIIFHQTLHRPGTLIDVGAHDGGITLPLAALPESEVIAFEPLPTAFARLQAATQNTPNVTLRPEALGSHPGTLSLEVPYVHGVAQEQWASMVKNYGAMQAIDARIDQVARFDVAVITLDSLNLQNVTGMKIDAEGAEMEVLQGAEATLRRCMPVLSVEIEERHRIGATRDVPAFLANLGYRGFFELDGAWHDIATFDSATMQVASPSPAEFSASDPYVFVFYFVPPDRVAELAALARLA
jgi:FkbM family methyltransferase